MRILDAVEIGLHPNLINLPGGQYKLQVSCEGLGFVFDFTAKGRRGNRRSTPG